MNTSTPSARQPCPCGSGKQFRKCCGKPPMQRALGRPSTTRRLVELPNGQTLPLEQALHEAMALQRAGRYRRAADIYRALLVVSPTHADALHLLGVAERQAGRLDEAISLIRRAIEIRPSAVLFHNNLSEAYRTKDSGPEAESAARKALKLDPRLPEAYLNLGAALHIQRKYEDAISAYRQALKLRPHYPSAELGIGDALMVGGKYDAALEQYRTMLERQPGDDAIVMRIGMTLRRAKRTEEAIRHFTQYHQANTPGLYHDLSQIYIDAGRFDEAASCLRKLLELTPDDVESRHWLDALEGKVPESAPAEYVRKLFDQYADSFEAHLVGKLEYRTPALIGDALRPMIGLNVRLDILDLGCGTGLMGEVLRDVSNRLVGVDISPKMVDKTRGKNIYAETHAEDLLAFMQRSESASFDLVVAADVFNYIGNLAPVFRESSRLLRANGLFAFSVESMVAGEQRDLLLDKTGRYLHSDSYVRGLARDAGLIEAHFSQVVLRKQSEQPVRGSLCVYSKQLNHRLGSG